MTIEQRTVVDSVTSNANGVVTAHLRKQIIRDGIVIADDPHEIGLEPGADVNERLDALNTNLAEMGCALCVDFSMVSAIATATWTPENVTAWSAEFIAQQAELRAASEAAVREQQAALKSLNDTAEAIAAKRLEIVAMEAEAPTVAPTAQISQG